MGLDIRRLAMAIEDSGLKKGDIAKKTGITPGTLSRYLNGQISPDRPVIYNLSRILGVTPEWLSGLTPEPSELEHAPGYHIAAHQSNADNQLATSPVIQEEQSDYLPDAVALTGLDADERRTMIRMLDALRSGDAEIRRHLIGQLKIIEFALISRRQQSRAEKKDGA